MFPLFLAHSHHRYIILHWQICLDTRDRRAVEMPPPLQVSGVGVKNLIFEHEELESSLLFFLDAPGGIYRVFLSHSSYFILF